VSRDTEPALPYSGMSGQIAHFRLNGYLGRGARAVVYLAQDERTQHNVALKVMSPELASDTAFRSRLLRESRIVAAVTHPNILPVYEADEADGVLYVAMRYVQGGDARSLLNRYGPLPAASAWEIVASVASALDAAHTHGLVHGDVRPANILLDAQSKDNGAPLPDGGEVGQVYLADFGMSRSSAPGEVIAAGQAEPLDYAAPEQIEKQEADGRADLYSLACTGFELLCGSPPFGQDQGLTLMYAQLYAAPPLASARRLDLPAAVDGVLATALAKEPADRFSSCGQFAEALRAALRLGPGDSAGVAPPLVQDGPAMPVPGSWADYLPPGPAHPPAPEYPAGPGYPPAGPGYRPAGPAYPPAGPAYPPAGPAYPPGGPAYPPGGPAYPPAGPAYPPAGPAYPPAGPAYPPAGPAYPPAGPAYPPAGPAYLSGGPAYPPGSGVSDPGQQQPPDATPMSAATRYGPWQTPTDPQRPVSPPRPGTGPMTKLRGTYSRTGRLSAGKRLVLAVAAAAVVIAGIVVGISLAGKSAPSTPAASSHSAAASRRPSASSLASRQAAAVSSLLGSSAATRRSLEGAVAEVRSCTSLGRATSQIRTVVGQRSTEYSRVAALSVNDLVGGVVVKSDLLAALRASLAADRDYLTWARQQRRSGCTPTAQSGAYATAISADSQAGLAKHTFVRAWNPIAAKYGLPQESPGDI
jgi:serine/threonine protein kinase